MSGWLFVFYSVALVSANTLCSIRAVDSYIKATTFDLIIIHKNSYFVENRIRRRRWRAKKKRTNDAAADIDPRWRRSVSFSLRAQYEEKLFARAFMIYYNKENIISKMFSNQYTDFGSILNYFLNASIRKY